MKREEPKKLFWSVLALLNVLALMYPMSLLLHASSVGENLFATFVLIVFVFLLAAGDAVSILVADLVGSGTR